MTDRLEPRRRPAAAARPGRNLPRRLSSAAASRSGSDAGTRRPVSPVDHGVGDSFDISRDHRCFRQPSLRGPSSAGLHFDGAGHVEEAVRFGLFARGPANTTCSATPSAAASRSNSGRPSPPPTKMARMRGHLGDSRAIARTAWRDGPTGRRSATAPMVGVPSTRRNSSGAPLLVRRESARTRTRRESSGRRRFEKREDAVDTLQVICDARRVGQRHVREAIGHRVSAVPPFPECFVPSQRRLAITLVPARRAHGQPNQLL